MAIGNRNRRLLNRFYDLVKRLAFNFTLQITMQKRIEMSVLKLEPLTSHQLTPGTPILYPRVNATLTIKELRDEYLARGISTKAKGQLTKNALLEVLIDDTILLSQTDAYKKVQMIKEAMNSEESIKVMLHNHPCLALGD